MTNPDNAVGTNAAYGGRTSVNAFNDDLAAYSRGVLSGWACEPDSGLTVVIGGDGNTRDVAIAEDSSGNKTTINNISGSPISVTIDAAPAANSRIDAIVAYVDASPQGSATITDNYEACGLITVNGTASASPVAPTENMIRSAITADGASGATAYYVVLAYITLATGTTDITSANIGAGQIAQISSDNISIIASNIAETKSLTSTITTTEQNIITLTVPQTGTYLVTGYCRAQEWSAGSSSFLVMGFKVNGDFITSTIGNPISRGSTYRAIGNLCWSGTLNANDSVDLYVRVDAGTAQLRNTQTLALIKID